MFWNVLSARQRTANQLDWPCSPTSLFDSLIPKITLAKTKLQGKTKSRSNSSQHFPDYVNCLVIIDFEKNWVDRRQFSATFWGGLGGFLTLVSLFVLSPYSEKRFGVLFKSCSISWSCYKILCFSFHYHSGIIFKRFLDRLD